MPRVLYLLLTGSLGKITANGYSTKIMIRKNDVESAILGKKKMKAKTTRDMRSLLRELVKMMTVYCGSFFLIFEFLDYSLTPCFLTVLHTRPLKTDS